jgi:hypothetical protein
MVCTAKGTDVMAAIRIRGLLLEVLRNLDQFDLAIGSQI